MFLHVARSLSPLLPRTRSPPYTNKTHVGTNSEIALSHFEHHYWGLDSLFRNMLFLSFVFPKILGRVDNRQSMKTVYLFVKAPPRQQHVVGRNPISP